MSDHESEVSPASPDAGSSLTGSFSSNGNDPGGYDVGTDGAAGGEGISFLDDLAQAMRSTAAAEQARDLEATEQRRKVHLDSIRAREALEAEQLRELAKEDVKGIDAWSDGEIKRIKLERERRIASRREQLQVRLEEHRMVIGNEVEAVEAAVTTYRLETERFFDRLGAETDPVEIARQAGTRPPFPALDQIGPDDAPPISAYQAPVHSASAAYAPPPALDTNEQGQDLGTSDTGESVQADAETTEASPEEAVAESEDQSAGDGSSDGSAEAGEMVGVMAAEGGNESAQTPWGAGVAAVAEPAGSVESVGETTEAAATSNEGLGEGSEESDEAVSVGGESRVVIPRSTGAGSWLRWPNSSVDRSDPTR